MIRFKKKKNGGQKWLAWLTFVSLLMLVVIQVTWIIKAANLEEKNFNYQVSKAMKSVREELGRRASGCNHMKTYLCGEACPSRIRDSKIKEIDSIVQSQLEIHNIQLNYNLSIGDSLVEEVSKKRSKSKCYLQSLNGLIEKDGIRLCLQFPSRNQFLLAQIGGWFILSILFILLVAVSFLLMMRLFSREKAMLVRTGDFINNMVHEFQTPLANVKLASNLIQKKLEPELNSKVSEYIQVIRRESQKLEANVTRILDVSNRNLGEDELEAVDIHQCILSALEPYQFRISERGAIVNLSLNAKSYHLMAVHEHVGQMISNLIDNALKYSKDHPVIDIETENQKQNLVMVIRDNGIGIAKKDQPYVFDQYYRVSTGNVHDVKGFGLGLTYVKRMTELYNGSIELTSQLGQGCEFKLIFPVNNGTIES